MAPENKKSRCFRTGSDLHFLWWRGKDLNLRPRVMSPTSYLTAPPRGGNPRLYQPDRSQRPGSLTLRVKLRLRPPAPTPPP